MKRYNGTGNDDDFAAALAVSPDGTKVFVTGRSYGSTTFSDYATIAYDTSTGARLWLKRYDGRAHGNDSASAIAMSPDGSTVFVTGASSGSTTSDDYATVAYDASTGAKLWVTRYDGPGNASDRASALAVGLSGSGVFVTGASSGSTTSDDYATVAYDATTGAELWVTRYDGASGRDSALAVAVSPDTSMVFVTGYSHGSATGVDYATVAYDAPSGATLWARRYNGRADGHDTAVALGVSPGGSKVFVTGQSKGTRSRSDYDLATVAYNASTGARQWVSRHSPSKTINYPNDLELSPDGSTVIVAGGSVYASSATDYAIVAYRAAGGATRWTKRYNGPANSNDTASAVAFRPIGAKVFVTGYSLDSAGKANYATVAYKVA